MANMTHAETKKLIEQMLVSFAAVLDSEFRHKLEAIELREATKADDKIRRLDALIEDIHQSIYEIEERLSKEERLSRAKKPQVTPKKLIEQILASLTAKEKRLPKTKKRMKKKCPTPA